MPGQILRGKLLGVVRGPAIILEIRGEEKKVPLEVDPPVSWVQEHMDSEVMVVVTDGRVVEVM